jgi:hypothetical protein
MSRVFGSLACSAGVGHITQPKLVTLIENGRARQGQQHGPHPACAGPTGG